MKSRILVALVALMTSTQVFAQRTERQTGDADTSYHKTLIPETKQTLLKNMSMIANMNYALRNEFIDNKYDQTRFRHEQFRLELRGMVHEKVYFRFRNRYTKSQTSESIDKLSGAVDLAYIRIDASKKLSISAGKMCADWGGFEFDYNPIDIYEYSDIIEYADNFLSGAGVSYAASSRHSFSFQALDSRTKTFEELYGKQPVLVESKAPLAFVSNWRGNLLGGKLKTIWSYSLFTEAKGTFMNYIALGNELTLGKFVVAYDYKLSNEQLDRTGVVSATIPDSIYAFAVQNTQYSSHWLHLHYRVNQNWNLALFGMVDFARWQGDTDPSKNNDLIRTAWGFIPTIEYYPFKDLNLRFFANYVGRVYDYTNYAETRFGSKDYSTGRFTIGFITPLGIF